MLEMYQAYADYNHVMTMSRRWSPRLAPSATSRSPTATRDRPDAALAARHDARGHRGRTGIDIAPTTRAPTPTCRRASRPGLDGVEPLAHTGASWSTSSSASTSSPSSSSRPSSSTTRSRSPRSPRSAARPAIRRALRGLRRRHGVGNAFTELNDPHDQRERFEQQTRPRRRRRDPTARRGFPRGAGARHAADRRPGHGHRPPGDDAHRPPIHPRGHPRPPAPVLAQVPPARRHRQAAVAGADAGTGGGRLRTLLGV